MNNDLIVKFLEPTHLSKTSVKIEFKKRNTIIGVFVESPDYQDLKAKNFWRIVTEASIPEWQKTKDHRLSKIFSGSEFTRLTQSKEKAV
ncbi:short-chain dehydrogenase [Ferruginibacter sp.]|jgi:hypothetical protein|nr:short-chain dehydrogenase [Ferruginibacter sp.]